MEEQVHNNRFHEFMDKHTKQDLNDGGKTVATIKHYEPLLMYVIAGELSIMNDYLSRIAEALEGHADEG